MKKILLILCFTLLTISLLTPCHSETMYYCVDSRGLDVWMNFPPPEDYTCAMSSYREPTPQERAREQQEANYRRQQNSVAEYNRTIMDAQIQAQERTRQLIDENERARVQSQAETKSRLDTIRWRIKEKESELQNITSRGPDFKGAQYFLRWQTEVDAKRAEIRRLWQDLQIQQ